MPYSPPCFIFFRIPYLVFRVSYEIRATRYEMLIKFSSEPPILPRIWVPWSPPGRSVCSAGPLWHRRQKLIWPTDVTKAGCRSKHHTPFRKRPHDNRKGSAHG